MTTALKPVTITQKAAIEVKHIMENKNIPQGYALRVGVKGGGGCGGMSYLLGFDTPKESDLSYEFEGIPVLVDKKHTMYLLGMEVDFFEGNDARGFTFINPNAEKQAESTEASEG